MNFTNTLSLKLNNKSKYGFYKSFTVLLFAFLCSMPIMKATHIVGGELNYTHISGDQYEISLVFYRDCFHGAELAPFDDPASIGLFDGSNNLLLNEFLIPLSAINDTLTPIPSDTCLIIPDEVCVHTTTYSKVVTLPFRAGGYILSYQRCCRNETISNIVDPLNTGATYQVQISEEALMEHNTGAKFNEWPPLFICVNEPLIWDHSATDVDGDSLVYSLCQPFSGGSDADNKPQPPHNPPYDHVVWEAPYNTDNMLGVTANNLKIDAVTGEMTAFPTVIGQFVVGVCLEEYRNGVKISTIYRDFQYNVGQCRSITALIGNDDVQCENLTVDFINNSTDANNFEWDFGDPTNPTASSTDFEPSYSYPDTGHYTITLRAKTGFACADTTTFDIHLKNKSLFADFEYLLLDCGDSSIVTVNNLSFDSVSTIAGYEWELSDIGGVVATSSDENPSFAVTIGDDYTLSMNVLVDDGCSTLVAKDFKAELTGIGEVKDSFLICPGGSVHLNDNPFIGSNISYSWSPSASLDDANIGNPLASPSATTRYTLTMNDINSGCSGGYDVLVKVQTDNAIILEADTTICSNSITLHAQTTGISTFEWLNEAGDNVGTGSETTVSSTGTEIYTLNTVDENGCAFSDQISVTTSPVYQSPNFEYDIISCGDDIQIQFTDLTIHPNGVVSSWNWSFGGLATSNLQNPMVTFSNSGILVVTLMISNEDGCSEMISKNITLDDYLMDVSHLDAVVSNCNLDPMELNPNGNPDYEYHWSPAIGLSDVNAMNPLASPGITTEYTVVVVDPAKNCQVSRTVTYTLPDNPLDATFDWTYSSCLNNVEIEFSHTAPYSGGAISSYEWLLNGNPVATGANPTFTINSNQFNEVTLNLIADDGCTTSNTEEIDVSKLDLEIPDGDLFVCKGECLTLNNNGNDSYVYSWTPNTDMDDATSPSPTVCPEQTTTYTVHAEIAGSGCSAEATYKVVVPTELVKPDFSYTFDNCDNPIELTFDNATVYADATIVDYAWTFEPNSTMAFDEDTKLIVTTEEDVVVTLKATGDDGCEAEIEKVIGIHFLPTSTIKDSLFICKGGSVNLNEGGDETAIYLWTPVGSLDDATSYNPLASPTETTTYNVTVSDAANTECIEELTTKVQVPEYKPDFDISALSKLACSENESTFTISNNTTIDGADIKKWEWTLNGTIFSTKKTPDVIEGFNPSGEFVLTVTTRDGCSFSQTLVKMTEEEGFGSRKDTLYICIGEEVCLNPDNVKASAYLWNGGDLVDDTSVNPCVSPTENTTYTGILDDYEETNLCELTWEILVIVRDLPDVVAEKPTGCIKEEGSITLTPNPDITQGLTYDWSPNDKIKDGQGTEKITFDIDGDMTFDVTITNKFGCTIEQQVTVNINDFDDYVVTADLDAITEGDSTRLHVNGKDDFTYSWFPPGSVSDPTSADPLVYPNDTTTFTVFITDEDGCKGQLDFLLAVKHYSECARPWVYIPNAFSPNGDGLNDILHVDGWEIEEMHLIVFDRWGQKIFESNDQGISWDGTFKGKLMPPDVYGYYLTVKCFDGDDFVEKGNVTLLR